jgi:two-component system sensor histidine kinase DegS
VAQEAITNVIRHAQAHHITLSLIQNKGQLELDIEDDGVGFDPGNDVKTAASPGKLGLLGMAERVELVGGRLTIDTTVGRGTRIHAAFPVQQEGKREL